MCPFELIFLSLSLSLSPLSFESKCSTSKAITESTVQAQRVEAAEALVAELVSANKESEKAASMYKTQSIQLANQLSHERANGLRMSQATLPPPSIYGSQLTQVQSTVPPSIYGSQRSAYASPQFSSSVPPAPAGSGIVYITQRSLQEQQPLRQPPAAGVCGKQK